LKQLAQGLTAGIIELRENGEWIWHVEERPVEPLGWNLSTALYQIGEFHRRFKDLKQTLETSIAGKLASLTPEERRTHESGQCGKIERVLRDMSLRERRGDLRPEEALDRPVYQALLRLLGGGQEPAGPAGRR
jgi:hypothetical protein